MASPKRRWQITSDKFLTLEQIERLKSYLRDARDLAIARQNGTQAIRDHYAVRTLLESGLRVFEFCTLTNADFSGLKLSVRHGKGNKPRTVLLTRTTANLLKEWIAVKAKLGHDPVPTAPLFSSRYGRAYSTRGVQKRVKLIFAATGLPAHLSVHSLRHTYCSLLLASGKVGIATVKANLGHHSISVTNLYAHAVGNLDDVELYPTPSSEMTGLCEPQGTPMQKKASNAVTAFLRNANFKRRDAS